MKLAAPRAGLPGKEKPDKITRPDPTDKAGPAGSAHVIVEDFMVRSPKNPLAPKRLPALVDDCPCTQTRCHRHGNCVECIRVHRTRQEHIPECLQDMFRSRIKKLAALVEYDILDLRRTPAYWDGRLGKEPLAPSRGPGGSPAKKPTGKRSVAKRK